MPFFSIIIPVYNVAPYLRECLDSVVAQTFADWEAICVDDGSTDGSGAILDEYAAKDSRFKVIHQPNAGVSAARQVGLMAADGKYLGFVDPDDWIDPEMFECLINVAEDAGADYVWENFSSDSARGVGRRKDEKYDDCYQIINSLLEGRSLASLCVRLFRLEFVREHGIAFLPGRIRVCEDLCFICEVLSYKPRWVHVGGSHYHYRNRNGSITRTTNIGTFESWKVVCERLKRLLIGTPSENSLTIFMQGCRFSAFLSKCVSDEYFYSFLPDVKDTKGLKASLPRKILFELSVHGMRGLVMKIAWLVRQTKILLRLIHH